MATLQITFGSADLSSYFSNFSESNTNRFTAVRIPQRDGAIIQTPTVGTKIINLSGSIFGTNHENTRDLVNSLTGELYEKGFDKLRIYNDKFINCYIESFEHTIQGKDGQTEAKVKARFRADASPFWENDTAVSSTQNATSGDVFLYTNNGTANTPPKITIVNCTGGNMSLIKFEIGVTNWSYTGVLAAGAELVVDSRSFTVTNSTAEDFGNFDGNFITLVRGVNSLQYTGLDPVGFNITYNPRWYNY